MDLTESTIEANKALLCHRLMMFRSRLIQWASRPSCRLKRILIIASGEDKAEIVHKAFFGPITPQVPASVLQLRQ